MKIKSNVFFGALALFIALPHLSGQVLTFSTNTLTVGLNPYCVCATDIKGNGIEDLISANSDVPGTLTVLTNDGSGNFRANTTLAVGGLPYCVIAADVNRDGKSDLITANTYDDTLTVLTNNGVGGYGWNATLPVGLSPSFVAAADINGDGKMDLISANGGNNTLTVYTNDGSGVLGSNATLNVGAGPQCVVAVDINGSGKPDLVSANYYPGASLSVLTNNGSGVFGSNATLTVSDMPFLPYYVTAADINGDGRPDLIVVALGGYNYNNLALFTNNGTGGFGLNALLQLPAGSNPYGVVVTDINGDGKPDLVSANQGNSTLTVFTNNGSGDFGLNTTLDVASGPGSVVAADLNGDGKPDLISANFGPDGNTLTVLLNTTVFPPPILSIAYTNSNAILSWSSPLTGFMLQTNSSLITPNWGSCTNSIFTNGLVKSASIFSPQNQLFFRLKK
jgi:hypothetical protein